MTNGNDFAFATADNGTESKTTWQGQNGLTKREYFAAMAMQGILANAEFLKNHDKVDIHSLSVKNADYIIAELNKS